MSKVYKNKKGSVIIVRDKWGYTIDIGYECGESSTCKFRDKCKYAPRNKRNLYFHFREWVFCKTGKTLPWPIHFGKVWKELSGTEKCPFKVTERTGCHKCANCIGTDNNCHFLCGLPRKEGRRAASYNDEYWNYQCKDYKRMK